jgi:integrase
MRVLEPIWRNKTETASRLRGRIESVLDYAAAHDWRASENPARWRGHLQKLLAAPNKIARVDHHAALPWREIGTFMAELRDQEGVAARALEFVILTAARTGEVIGATWSEFDIRTAVWTVPAERMKAGREHRVPLSDAVLSVMKAVAPMRDDHFGGWIFPGGRIGRPLSNMSMIMLLRRMRCDGLTVHGFRSTFRDWCAETTNHPREVAEQALAHVLGDKVEAAYRRSDLFEKRGRLMQDWARFCAMPPTQAERVPLGA